MMKSDMLYNHFPHLPPYSDPQTGILSVIPPSCVPYAQLMRLDRPAGFYAFYLPYLIGVLYASCIAPDTPNPATVAGLAALLVPLNLLLRGAACAWNDNVDQDFDRKVARCRHRPVARGAVSTIQAHIFTASLLLACYPLLHLFPPACTAHMAMTVVLFFIYALMKRITDYPQVFLGLPFSWAIIFCLVAFDMDPFVAHHTAPTWALFASSCFWTITYDTIYAHQDIEDDEKAGVRGMALRFKSSTKRMASVMATGQVAMLALCGWWSGFGRIYFTGAVGGVAFALAYYIYSVDLKSAESCGTWFGRQFWTVGSAYTLGFGAEYFAKLAMRYS